MTAPIIFLTGIVSLVFYWMTTEPATLTANFDMDGKSFVEAMTIPLFAAVIPLTWLCTPVGGSMKRKVLFNSVFSVLGFMAIVRELDWHKACFNSIWPDLAAGFKGTVFKMRFLTADSIPLMPKLFVIAFFILFFASAIFPLAYFFIRLFKGFFKFHPVCWTMAFFGFTGVMIQLCDRIPSMLRKAKAFPPELMEKGTGAISSLFTAFEEGGEFMLAVFACLAIIQAHAIYSPDTPNEKFKSL
jgi:hypothetical protein